MRDENFKEFTRKLFPLIISLYATFILFFFFKDYIPTNSFAIDGAFTEIIFTMIIVVMFSISFSFIIRKKLIPRFDDDAYKIRIETTLEDKYNLEKNKRLNAQKKLKDSEKELVKMKTLAKSNSNSLFLKTSLKDRLYREKIVECMGNAKEKILVISPYWNNDLVHEFIKKSNSSCQIRVISTPADKSGQGGRFHKPAVEQLKDCLKKNLKTNNFIHSRLIIYDDKELICGSADLSSLSLAGDKVESGIWTKDPSVITDAILFFEDTWINSK